MGYITHGMEIKAGMLAVNLFFFLCAKHFIADFAMQNSYMYLNKGNFRHPGGYLHAFIHAYLSLFILWALQIDMRVAWCLALLEFVAHYVIDWGKVNINKATGWGPTNSEEYWVLLGFDQFLHSLTYIGMVWYSLRSIYG